jgi:hypothetical protein
MKQHRIEGHQTDWTKTFHAVHLETGHRPFIYNKEVDNIFVFVCF